MKTEIISVTSRGQGMDEALAMTEKLGAESGLERKQNLRLRLLAEELFGMLRGIAGDVEADYWLEKTDRNFALHLKSNVVMTREMREQLIAVSTSGENAAARGFMGKLREMIAVALLPDESGRSGLTGLSLGFAGLSMGFASMADPSSVTQLRTDVFRWSMLEYKKKVDSSRSENTEAEAAWDELERSIVASIADEVSVCVVNSDVEIIISKAF